MALDYDSFCVGRSTILRADCLEWLSRIPENSIHAIVTNPPYGLKEYEFEQLKKRSNGSGGIWRIPPSFDGHVRSPLPRFTALNRKEREIRAGRIQVDFDIDQMSIDAVYGGAVCFVQRHEWMDLE